MAAGSLPDDSGDVLLDLGYGPFQHGLCAPVPPSRPGSDWLRITGMPPTDLEWATPLESLLSTVAAQAASLDIVLRHGDDEGVMLLARAAGSGASSRVRDLLTPMCELEDSFHFQLPAWPATGVVHRLQPLLDEGHGTSKQSVAMLERVMSLPGDWLVYWRLAGTGSQEIDQLSEGLLHLSDDASSRVSLTRQQSSTLSATTTSAIWTRVQAWLDLLYGHAVRGRAIGLWRVATWVLAPSTTTSAQIIAALRSAVPDDEGRSFATSALDPGAGPEPVSLMTSRDVGGLLSAPRASGPGLEVRAAPPAGRRPSVGRERICLGEYWGTAAAAYISVDDLEGHAFLTGTTGAGKTTSLHRLLAEAWNLHKVPFLVVDPVKDEYSGAAALFDGGVRVVTGRELRLSLLEPWPGTDERSHVSQVAQAFRGAFTMPSPTPYVVTQLFDDVMMQPGGPSGTDLHDVRDTLESLIPRLGYAMEAQTNIRAALMTRLNVLLAPVRAHRFCWTSSRMVHGLFDGPTVITLADLVDDEERSFIVLLLAIATWSRARAHKPLRKVEHLLVLEEAHRVIPEVPMDAGDGESGSAKRVSSQLLSAMLAEVRSYGQQVIVVDQSPSKVSSDVLRNTNLKLVHRIVHPADQDEVAAAVGLPRDQAALLGSLKRGQVLVSTRSEPSPQTVRVREAVPSFPDPPRGLGTEAASWPCCHAVSAVETEQHFHAWKGSDGAGRVMALFLVGLRRGAGDGKSLRQQVFSALLRARSGPRVPSDCLAWAGLRRMLVLERSMGLVDSRREFEQLLSSSFEAWMTRDPVTSELARLPGRRGGAPCEDCGQRCAVRAEASVLMESTSRNGPMALMGPRWREDGPEVVAWGAAEVARLDVLLGFDAAWDLVRCEISQAARRGRLPEGVTQSLLQRIRSSLTPAPSGQAP